MSSQTHTHIDKHEHRADSPSAQNSLVFNESAKHWAMLAMVVIMAMSLGLNLFVLSSWQKQAHQDDLRQNGLSKDLVKLLGKKCEPVK